MNDLGFSIRSLEGVEILDLSGRIGIGETSSELHRKLKAMAEEGKRHILINMQKVTGIDSSGLGTLVAGYTTLEKNGGELKLVNLSPRVSELMTITKLYTVFEIFDDEKTAVNSFGKTTTAAASSADAGVPGARNNQGSIL